MGGINQLDIYGSSSTSVNQTVEKEQIATMKHIYSDIHRLRLRNNIFEHLHCFRMPGNKSRRRGGYLDLINNLRKFQSDPMVRPQENPPSPDRKSPGWIWEPGHRDWQAAAATENGKAAAVYVVQHDEQASVAIEDA